LMTSENPPEESQEEMMTTTHLSFPRHLAMTMIGARGRKRRRRKKSVRAACSDCSAASREKTWLRLQASRRSQRMTRKKKASAVGGSTGRTVGQHTADQTTTITVQQFRRAVAVKREPVALSEEKAKGGNLMMTRYIALLMRDSIVTKCN
jgi:hypothetical protein